MKAVFADTFYWIAVSSPRDAYHAVALQLLEPHSPLRITTSDVVILEYLNWCASRGAVTRRDASRTVDRIFRDPLTHVVRFEAELFEDAFRLYAQRLDKGYSMTDCISMQIMRREGLTDVLTHDHHFEQEGFRILFHGH